jgi:RNA polymerase sigma-54 factor
VLGELKTLKPWGMGARDLREALLIQMRNISGIDAAKMSKAERVVAAHLDDLLRGSLKKIAKLESISLEDVKFAAELAVRLSFSPLSFFEGDAAPTIVPDIKFFKRDGEWVADVNDTYYPRLKFSETYKNLLAECPDNEAIKYLKEQAKSARLLTDAISKRKATLRKIAQSILEHQAQFFEFGARWLKRLSMREIAEDISVSVSTVSRAIAGKYAETPHGTLELSKFLESGVNDCSAAFIKGEIGELLGSKGYLSDRKIADILNGHGIAVARRTISKYRRQLNLPNSRVRKVWRREGA